MRRAFSWFALLSLIVLLAPSPAPADSPQPMEFRPDPRTVQRYGPAYRYPQAGWIVLHIEGEPYERGYQHGRLMASEIAAYVRCFAALRSPKAPAEGWKNTRMLINSLFLRRYDKEYLEEMKGIADGATAAGARFHDRPIDLLDIVGLNSWPEIDTLDSALEATPTGLESMSFPRAEPRKLPPPKPMHCSAFAATGPATADGKIVFGHITMFSLYPSQSFNVWLDVKPTKGHRVLMQSYPGGIQSGLDYYLNDAGLLVCETTLAQTRFDIQGLAVASRIRQALQYADSIDKVVEVLKEANNGLYTNEWLLADTKTNEIAMFELGTAKSKLYRSSKKEWFGGTEGFYWGCNNTKDLDVRLETVPALDGKPANVVWHPSDRDRTWLKLFGKYQGKIDADFGKEAFTTAPIAAFHSVDAKFTTTNLARDLKTWALFGPPLGQTWKPTPEEEKRYPEIRPLVSNPWTILHTLPPEKGEATNPPAVDLPEKIQLHPPWPEPRHRETLTAWHGTLLPKTDADIWLATAFADYEKIVAQEEVSRREAPDGKLTAEDRDELAVALFGHRAAYLAAARAGGDTPLAQTHSELTSEDWYRVAEGKGVLLLNNLREILGEEAFTQAMDSFGRENAGKEVTSAQFQAHMEKAAGKSLATFFDYWLKRPGLPKLQLSRVRVKPAPSGSVSHRAGAPPAVGEFKVEGELTWDGPAPQASVEVTVETSKGEVTKSVPLDSVRPTFNITTAEAPLRVVVDKYCKLPKANGGPFSVLSFYEDLENTLIVYGTGDEVSSNREAALALQKAIRERWANITVPVATDQEVTDTMLKNHHLLLIGRPDSNRVVDRFRGVLPVVFGSRSFTVRGETYAHPDSAVIVAGENPLDGRYSQVVFAGLSAASTLEAAPVLLHKDQPHGEVLLLPHGARKRTLVLPAPELTYEVGKP